MSLMPHLSIWLLAISHYCQPVVTLGLTVASPLWLTWGHSIPQFRQKFSNMSVNSLSCVLAKDVSHFRMEVSCTHLSQLTHWVGTTARRKCTSVLPFAQWCISHCNILLTIYFSQYTSPIYFSLVLQYISHGVPCVVRDVGVWPSRLCIPYGSLNSELIHCCVGYFTQLSLQKKCFDIIIYHYQHYC